MNTIKAFVIFLFGAVYASLCWLAFTTTDDAIRIPATIFGCIFTIFVIGFAICATIEIFKE